MLFYDQNEPKLILYFIATTIFFNISHTFSVNTFTWYLNCCFQMCSITLQGATKLNSFNRGKENVTLTWKLWQVNCFSKQSFCYPRVPIPFFIDNYWVVLEDIHISTADVYLVLSQPPPTTPTGISMLASSPPPAKNVQWPFLVREWIVSGPIHWTSTKEPVTCLHQFKGVMVGILSVNYTK